MHLRKMAFGFGVITGAALTISLPYFVMKAKELKSCDDDQEKHEGMNVEKIKDEMKHEFAKMSEDVNETVDSVMQDMKKTLSSKKKKKK